ncbi:MAG: peptide chain release factor-like protein [Planctomycetota bacterium]
MAQPRCPTGFSRQLSAANEIVLEVKSGEGGDDAKLFVHELYTALAKYAKRHGLSVSVVTEVTGHVVAIVRGQNVWSLFQNQIGTHCVQRIPPTESRNRRHTSYVAVGVLPLIETNLAQLDASEIEVKTQGGHGPGGQHQNKSDSAVRMTHRPTGIQVYINGRSQHANRAEALRVLTARVHDAQKLKDDAAYRTERQMQLGQAGRGKKIRTYNFLNDRAVDHRTGRKSKVRTIIEKGQFERLT